VLVAVAGTLEGFSVGVFAGWIVGAVVGLALAVKLANRDGNGLVAMVDPGVAEWETGVLAADAPAHAVRQQISQMANSVRWNDIDPPIGNDAQVLSFYIQLRFLAKNPSFFRDGKYGRRQPAIFTKMGLMQVKMKRTNGAVCRPG
jgi:hypothetical protein